MTIVFYMIQRRGRLRTLIPGYTCSHHLCIAQWASNWIYLSPVLSNVKEKTVTFLYFRYESYSRPTVRCSGFGVPYTLKRKSDTPSVRIQQYSLVCGCRNHACLALDDLGFSFPQRNVPHVVSWNLESIYPLQYAANRFQRRTNSFSQMTNEAF